jgi:hypothetical protein
MTVMASAAVSLYAESSGFSTLPCFVHLCATEGCIALEFLYVLAVQC